ncbi:MAG TPA: thioredoxin family protein [Bacteroidota bacterium]|nr:thioredoxin family protein [Bacteroidota bacterium]
MVTVKILGSGCSKCKALVQRLLALKAAHTMNFDLVKITDIDEIISYGIMMTPGLVINGAVKSVGTVPKDFVLLDWLHERSQ